MSSITETRVPSDLIAIQNSIRRSEEALKILDNFNDCSLQIHRGPQIWREEFTCLLYNIPDELRVALRAAFEAQLKTQQQSYIQIMKEELERVKDESL